MLWLRSSWTEKSPLGREPALAVEDAPESQQEEQRFVGRTLSATPPDVDLVDFSEELVAIHSRELNTSLPARFPDILTW